MINQIIAEWQKSTMTKAEQAYTCRHCNKSFTKETTLISHMCEKKRRAQQEKEIGVQWGMQAYMKFYEVTQGSTKSKTYQDFASSSYYIAFVKYGRHCVDIKCTNFISYTTWLLKNNKKLDQWCHDKFYEEWLRDYAKKESVQDALERALKEMNEYAELHPELKNGYVDYFRYAGINGICHRISTGRISSWIVYNCESGIEFLSKLNQEQIAIIMPWIDPDHWHKRFKDNPQDVEWAKSILRAAGL
jgi:hypothetical protein